MLSVVGSEIITYKVLGDKVKRVIEYFRGAEKIEPNVSYPYTCNEFIVFLVFGKPFVSDALNFIKSKA